ncbi:MAG: ornithine cyclodeaminase [Bacteroidaceae bacterium]
MKLITQQDITGLNISPVECLEWIRNSFSLKEKSVLPPKTCLHTRGIDFFTSMPCAIPERNVYGVKVVHRLSGAVPSLGSDILLYNMNDGELLAIMDGNWITAMRTGAVTVLATQTLKKSGSVQYGVIGLGNTARAVILCLLENEPETMHRIGLLKYKDQADLFIERFKGYRNVKFTLFSDVKELIRSTDILYSCVTESKSLICEDDSAFREGCLIVPVHTRGFQNCDLFFDKVFADDTAHVKDFKYFSQFRYFDELQNVVAGRKPGRESDTERILSYNVGLGLHDIYFASRIYDMSAGLNTGSVNFPKDERKFWI